jgi:hypothetical protein
MRTLTAFALALALTACDGGGSQPPCGYDAPCPEDDGEGGEGFEDDWVEPVRFQPEPGELEAMDALCSLRATVEANWNPAGPTDAADLLQPTGACIGAISSTLTWGETFSMGNPGAERVQRTVAQAVWALFYTPVARHDGDVLFGFDSFPMPDGLETWVPHTVSELPVEIRALQEDWVNDNARDLFYDNVWKLQWTDDQGVSAEYSASVVTVHQPFTTAWFEGDDLMFAPMDGRLELASVLLHEALHGEGDAWDHEYCAGEQPGYDIPTCDDHSETSAYAMGGAWLQGSVLGLMAVEHTSGQVLASDATYEFALDATCDPFQHVLDAPAYVSQWQCGGDFGGGWLNTFRSQAQ